MAIQRTGTTGRDVFNATADAESFDGLFDHDIVSYGSSTAGLTLDLTTPGNSTGDAAGDTFVGIEAFSLTAHADTVIGSANKESINGGAGNDTIYAGGGNDTLTGDAGDDLLHGEDGNDGFFGGGGNDTIYGGNGDDTAYGDNNNDQLFGDAGNDKLYGGNGDDRLDGGAGNDLLDGGTGNDTFVITAGSGTDVITGGTGADTFELRLASSDLTAALRSDLAALQTYMANNLATAGSAAALANQAAGASLVLASLGITLSGIETVVVMVDGNPVALADLLNQAPTADPTAAITTDEDTSVSGTIAAVDADGDDLTWSVEEGPENGQLDLNTATGDYTYTPKANADGSDSFTIAITDPDGLRTVQTVTVSINAVADAPLLDVADATVSLDQTLVGGDTADELTGGVGDDTLIGGGGNDILDGDGAMASQTAVLSLSAALTDTDGSELLSIEIDGVPEDAVLSAGSRNPNGSWIVAAADLAGLTITTAAPTDLELTVRTVSTEANGSSATATATLSVTFDAGSGADRLDAGEGDDLVLGGFGNDLIIAGGGTDKYDGGTGFDTVDFSDAAAGVKVSLGKGTASSLGSVADVDRLVSIEQIVGSAFADQLKGSAGNEVFYGGDGDDVIVSGDGHDGISDGAGNDKVNAGKGDDVVIAGSGNDHYIGGSGFDTLDYSSFDAAIQVNIGKRSITGAASGNDKVSGFESVIGTDFADTFTGNKSVNVFDGGAGDDLFRGMGGADIFTGGDGNDRYQWSVKDVVIAGVAQGADRITDFAEGDVLDLREFTKANRKLSADDYVRLVDGEEGTTVSVKVGATHVSIAVLEGVHQTSLSEMLSDGSILL